MTPSELIPVLRALHANPTTAPVFADWFDEQGDENTAHQLRTFNVESLLFRGQYYTNRLIELVCHVWNRDPIFKDALVAEACERLKTYNLTGRDRRRLDEELRYGQPAFLLGTRPESWMRVPHDPGWDWNRHAQCDIPLAGFGHAKSVRLHLQSERVKMTLKRIQWEPDDLHTLCGGWLQLTTSIWFGKGAISRQIVVTIPDVSLARDPQLHLIPF